MLNCGHNHIILINNKKMFWLMKLPVFFTSNFCCGLTVVLYITVLIK